MAQPDITQTMTDIRAALLALEAELTPAINTHAGVLYSQAAPPYWTNLFSQLTLGERATGMMRYTLTVTATYHAGYVTEGSDVEIAAQNMLAVASALFMRRPFLQSATVADGVAGIDAEGVTLQTATITASDMGDARTALNVGITLSIPLLFLDDTEDF